MNPGTCNRSLLSSIPDAVILIDGAGKCVDANAAALALLGYEREELIERTVAGILVSGPHQADRSWRKADIQRKDGTRAPVHTWTTDLPETDESNGSIAVFLRPASGHMEEDAAWARMAAIIASSSEAFIGTTLDGEIISWNPPAERLFGYSTAEVIGERLSILAPEEDAGEVAALMRRLNDGESIQEIETVRRTRDGRLIDIAISISPVRDASGKVFAASAIVRDISARKTAETERAAILLHTRQVLERITDGFYALDREWRFTYVNDAAERMLGRRREALLGTNLWEAFPPTLETPLYGAYHEALATGVPVTFEFYYPPFEHWIEVRVFPAPDGLSVFFRDITQSRQLKEELHASETKYRTLVEQLPAAVYVLAADEYESPLYYSPRFQELTGFSPEDAMTRTGHWLDSVHAEDRARVAEEDARTEVSGEPFRAEYRHIRKDGSYVWVRDESVAVRDESGQIMAWQGMLLDVTERVEAEETQLRLAAIVTSSSEAIIGTTLDGIITNWNPAAERLYGYGTAEAIGQSVIMLTPPGLPGDVAGLLAQVRRGESVEGYETTRLTKDGRRIAVSLAISPVRDASGDIVAISSVARDITEFRRLQEERDRLYAELAAEFQRAAEIQAQMLPHAAPDVVGYEFAGVCLSARQVGGDFFDWLAARDVVRLSLGDVMGKGMPASLLTATVRAALRSVTHLPVSAAVEAVNRALSPDLVQSDSFITLFHASLEPESGQLTYVDAGHGLAFVQRCDGGVEPLRQRGLPLGVLPDAAYPEGVTTLEPGDTLVIHSDGLPDARPELRLDPVGVAEQIGELKNAQAKLDRLVSLVADVDTRPDDLTLVLVRRQEEPSPDSGKSLTRESISR